MRARRARRTPAKTKRKGGAKKGKRAATIPFQTKAAHSEVSEVAGNEVLETVSAPVSDVLPEVPEATAPPPASLVAKGEDAPLDLSSPPLDLSALPPHVRAFLEKNR